ncbi:MAG: PAS domain-containing sensor histidine kinase [Syntrophobacteraceae bacterium]
MTTPEPESGRKRSPDCWQETPLLRERAEERLKSLEALDRRTFSPEEARELLHELRVHQIELEMQNEELRGAQAALDLSRTRYFALYDLAPIGYCTLSSNGIILDANLTASTLFDAPRGALVKSRLSRFIHRQDQDIFYLHLRSLFESNLRQVSELRMHRKNGDSFWARLESIVNRDEEDEQVCRMVISDITERKLAENALRQNELELRNLSARLLSAHEEERKKVAAELHDSLGSSLTAIKMGIENARAGIDRTESGWELLDPPLAWTQLAIDEVRRLMAELRPPVIDDMGAIAALQWFFRQFRTTYPRICIEVQIGIEERDIPEALRIVMFRIAQEAFHNIAKHSRATHVAFSLERRNDTITLEIEDNGVGFDLKTRLSKEQRFGLTGMKERAELSGGSLTIHSARGKGTTVGARWPLKRGEAGSGKHEAGR